MTQHRQGDVLLSEVQALPTGVKAVPLAARGVVLAEGEATGHAHVMPAECTRLWEIGLQRYVEVTSPAQIKHEEHGGSVVQPGIYEVMLAHEYTDENEWRKVRD